MQAIDRVTMKHAADRNVLKPAVNGVLALAYAARPHRLAHPLGFLRLAAEKLIHRPAAPFQRRPEEALTLPDGLVDIGGPMSLDRLIAAYAEGIYPWCHIGPIKWWAPSRRAVLFLEESRIEKSLRRVLRQRKFTVTFDTAFDAVIEACAEPRPGRPALTWITPRFITAYRALHRAGHAHSVEVWDADGNLAGGLYGVASGGLFFTESQFARSRDTSKIAFVTLNRHLAEWGYVLNDGKAMTGHLAALGMRDIPRAEFMSVLKAHREAGRAPGRWQLDPALDVAGWEPVRP
ncbi:leucyl/phenylalanyl-tRNA--protein transferase [uncultured Parvibaculum sp.]|uniref:leucyl/phenylalanyl-tRNA--protein transferase n=1 Tax=uncultured Parvibaculum sp. TaxID=291828 RepID=UPI0030EB3F68|tara:strand:- start:2298 stop:3170 length:873 start_codon:yes stop_codon:yes gene_type:complete